MGRIRRDILCIIGTRPEAIKMAPVIAELRSRKRFRVRVLATAQHRQMLDQVLRVFRLRTDRNLHLMQQDQTLDQR